MPFLPSGVRTVGAYRKAPAPMMLAANTTLRMSNGSAAQAGLVDGRYRLEEPLGRGAMGCVFRAYDAGLERTVAVKMVDPAVASHPQMASMFRREATALARVRSEHVVQVYSSGTHEGVPFFAMELVEGADLEAIISSYRERGGVVPLPRAATILRQAASGLEAVHAHGVVHRDVKPSNVLVETGTGRPVLIDFGIAAGTFEDRHSAGVVGTPHYMAPEQWAAGTITAATDVYGFGALAYELLTGEPPFSGDTPAILMGRHIAVPPPLVSAKRPSAVAFDAIVARALAKDPRERFADGRALGLALEEAFRKVIPGGASAVYDPLAAPSLLDGVALDALVVDDDETFRAFAERALRIAAGGLRLRVRGVSSGEGAIALAQRGMPDLVVLDFDMPGLNGLQTLSYLRALPEGARARVLVVTGSVEKIGRCQFDVMGVADFVAKPVPVRELARILGGMTKRG